MVMMVKQAVCPLNVFLQQYWNSDSDVFFVVEWCDQFHCRGHYHVCPTHTHTYTFDDSFSTSFNWIVYNLFSRSGSSSSQTQWMNSDCLFWTVCIYECVCVCVLYVTRESSLLIVYIRWRIKITDNLIHDMERGKKTLSHYI